MKNFHNIEGRKNRTKNAYVGYGGGHVWYIWKTTWKGWIAETDAVPFVLKGRVLDDISAKLAAL